ncbi:MAG: hypothetical protein CMN76_11320 [Spirochaetaceae bacterium]|nr:hypothetical protein [Spirochaetaceae bacterium]|tara:strand:+ start:107368 stop:107730 length:363 start_codon:yes stop_codon:yes gene_type:complete
MYTVEVNGNRLEVTMEGVLDGPAMKQALDDLETKSAGIQDGTLLYDVVDFQLPTLDAVMIEFARLPSMLGLIGRFKKAAVLSDMTWLKQISQAEGLLIPGITIKGFNRDEREEAIQWLDE